MLSRISILQLFPRSQFFQMFIIIGHNFLDMDESLGCIFLTIIANKSSEIGDIYSFQTALRETYASNADSNALSLFLALLSIQNIPIKLW
ncbi:hypothetical protein HETIRDRAFT_332201 [Heterobasidion irregulare TC 32-1]|uniref:Uncharacterized protein n=1 Tax=Heterobasidion irregulare (strain TC 32-1) TaxID=747525 RepID=W4JPL6_HETIT|nr:uncharacterized protein HETIRDRAFT_332201 [Heterobasidion irregulare TC 32-1]ETW75030.1 hypothetical protein HETIRDRAFT_332201 [Heterobasidion irregulare TC 32-1]